ncbi:MAG: glycosyltransferase [Bryobacter sp.]|nr:glycosyltransferase [Bryobacter sp.]
MRVLLVSSASYEPPKGGSTRSNLFWLKAIAAAGHACHVVCGAASEDQTGEVNVDGIAMARFANLSRDPSPIREAVDKLAPDFVLVSSEDVSHSILREAYRAAPARLVYIAHTPQWFPFGPEAWHQDNEAATIVRNALGIVAIGAHMAAYIEEHLGRPATMIHPAMYGQPPWPEYDNFETGKVLLINPCQVKGLPIFLDLAQRHADLSFLALQGWGTTPEDFAALRAIPNVEVRTPVADIEEVFRETSILLAPSLWYEGFGLVAMEAQMRGIPVLASDYGGLAESTAASLLRQAVVPIREWSTQMDATGMPIGKLEAQPIEAWSTALRDLATNRATYSRERQENLEFSRNFVQQWRSDDLLNYLSKLTPKRRSILLIHNSTYFPASGGGDKSNRLLLEALVKEGHTVEVFTRLERFGEEAHQAYCQQLLGYGIVAEEHSAGLRFQLGGVAVHAITRETNLRGAFRAALEGFSPEVILASTDDPAHLFLDLALDHPTARVVYLVRATVALPFGPDASTQNAERTARLARTDAVVGVSHYVAEYCRTYANLEGVHVPISLSDNPHPPDVGRFENPFVTLVNPSGVKGLPILLGLADAMPHVEFAAVPSWGTTAEDLAEMEARPNITLLARADDITDILRQTRITLVPSLWAEARSRVVLESLSRGVPVLASDVGGLREAMCGMDYVLPVEQITQYKDRVSDQMAPEAIVPEQDLTPWREALDRLITAPTHWEDISREGRRRALAYIESLSARPLEFIFDRTLAVGKRAFQRQEAKGKSLSPERRRLLNLRIRRSLDAQKDRYLPVQWGLPQDPQKAGTPALVLFPWAGAGVLSWRFLEEQLRQFCTLLPIRLPQREVRPPYPEGANFHEIAEAIAEELRTVVVPQQPLFFLGHSMGGALAYEVAWRILASGQRVAGLLASSCRAPHLRIGKETKPFGELVNLNSLDADIALFDAYQPQEPHILPIPVYAAFGKNEPNLRAEAVEAWQELTSNSFECKAFPGDHFWLKPQAAALAAFARRLMDTALEKRP